MNGLKGILKTLLFYGVGFTIALVCYGIFGWEYKHGPGVHHLVILLTLFGGFIWLVASTILYVFGERTSERRTIMLINALVLVGFFLYIAWDIHEHSSGNYEVGKRPEVTMIKSGDTTTMRHGGNLIYYKVKDSVFVNL